MRKPTTVFAGILAGSLLLAGCSTDAATSTEDTATGTTGTTQSEDSTTSTSSTAAASGEFTEVTYADLDVKDEDLNVDESSAVDIALADGATAAGDGYTVDGDTVTITDGGVYRLSGTLSAGQVVVATDDKDVTLILDGVDITAEGTGALDIEDADEVIILLADGSTNSLSDAADATASTDEDYDGPNAALFSRADMWITGDGSLTVNGVANDGITSKDGLVIDSGTINVTATDDGIRGKDYLVVLDGDITVDAGGDGLKADNENMANDDGVPVGVAWISGGTLDITAGVDGIDAYYQAMVEGGDITIAADDDGITTKGVLRIADGTVDITQSYEGLEGRLIRLTGGDGTIVASDDGFNVSSGSGSTAGDGSADVGGGMGGGRDRQSGGPGAAPSSSSTDDTASTTGTTATTAAYTTTASSTDGAIDVTTIAGGGGMGGGMEQAEEGLELEISGGTWYIDADGDGLDSNGDAVMTGGTVVVEGPTNSGNGAVDVSGEFTISGGTLLASGSSGMFEAPTADGQGVLSIGFQSQLAEGTVLTVTDADGDFVASFTTSKVAQAIVLSTTDVVSGETYTVIADATVTGDDFGGLVTDGQVSGGDELGTLTAD
ncbi:carbohydrate-binding domain-containing protein [Demequina rhizosphaerae]|uniref:carbohydrate-binding domain-containing protein n=1 Tax=Demequina rhizosphaerae TaxID=1638985 RepID=UPI000785E56B|nr:carbohydrate-binding domain-containing protein [Demequina rhizosphaerae]